VSVALDGCLEGLNSVTSCLTISLWDPGELRYQPTTLVPVYEMKSIQSPSQMDRQGLKSWAPWV